MTLYGWLYRQFKIFMHKHGWHHMETSRPTPIEGTLHWCHWCGLRVVVPDPDPMAIYRASYELAKVTPRSGVIFTGIKVPTQDGDLA